MCGDCERTRARGVLGQQQRRGYGDDAALRWPVQHVEEGREEGRKNAWGLSWDGKREEESGHAHAIEGDNTERANGRGVSNGTNASRMGANFFDSPRQDAAMRQHLPTQHDSADIESQVDLWERFESESAETVDARPREQAEVDDEAQDASIPADSLLEVDYKNDLRHALGRKAPDLVTRCLFAAAQAHDMDFLGSIPAPVFSRILQLLEPSQFVAKLGNAHIELSTAMAGKMNIAPMREVAFEYNKTLLRVLKDRRMTGHLPTIEDYTLLLRSARSLGSHKMATIVWRSLLKDGLRPNTQCFNYYMASIVWNGVHSAGSRQKVRVIPFNMLARSATYRSSRHMNYRIGDGGVKEDTMKAFGEMLAFGAVADHESFQTLITACARDGDIETVKAILQRVWGINVQAIMDGKDESTITPKTFSDHSPIRPQPSLLFALAHAFGINNDVASALRVVDFVARHYDLEITSETWAQLFEWTYVLAEKRHPEAAENVGKIPIGSVLSLWNTMTGAPYFIKPTLGMYSRLIGNLTDRAWTSKIIEVMHEALPLHVADDQAANNARRRLAAAIKRGNSDDGSIEVARQEWEYTRLICRRNNFWLRRWVRQVLTSLNIRNVFDGGKERFLDMLPQFLWDWRPYAPKEVRYETASGFVEIEFHAEHDTNRRAAVYEMHVEQLQILRDKSRRYVGDDWALDWKEPERNAEQRMERKERKAGAFSAKRFRELVDGPLPEDSGRAFTNV